MITFRDPPPLEVRVQSLKEPAIAPPIFSPPMLSFAIGFLVIAVLGIAASSANNRRSEKDALVEALSNALPRQVEIGLLALTPIGTSMRQVRARIDETNVRCRTTSIASTDDSLLTCLALPNVHDNSYSQISIRFASARGALTAVSACPSVVHWTTRTVPADIVRRQAAQTGQTCWRDETNVADNEWTYANVPDRAFTVARVHGADTVSRRAAATADTLVVDW